MNDFDFGWTDEPVPRPYIKTHRTNQDSAQGAARLLFGCVATATQSQGEQVLVMPRDWQPANSAVIRNTIDKLSALAFRGSLAVVDMPGKTQLRLSGLELG